MRRLAPLLLVAGCGGDDVAGSDGGTIDGAVAADASACPREPAAADRERGARTAATSTASRSAATAR